MRFLVLAALAVVSLLAGCGTGDSPAPTSDGGTSPSSTAPPATTNAPESTTGARRAPAPPPPRQAGLVGSVTAVVDGDTIRVSARGFETVVRLVGIDTPETRQPSEPVQCFGPAATDRVRRALPAGREVRLETDPTQDTRDRFGRLLAYVFTAGRSGPRGSVNYALVASGHAKVDIHEGVPFRYATAFQAAERRARSARTGLWGPPCNGDTTKPNPPEAPPPGSTPSGDCDPNYAGACIPRYPPDLGCEDVSASGFRSIGSDPHRFDGNGDGLACE